MLEVCDLNVNRGKKRILENINFKVKSGEIVGLVGPNGAGKSTLIKTLAGVVRKESGSIICDGLTIDANREKYLGRLQVCFDKGAFYPQLSGKENLMQVARLYGIGSGEVINCMQKVGLYDQKDVLVSKYSFGMVQRLNIAQMLMTKRPYILLDEPLNGIDPEGVNFFRKTFLEMRDEISCSLIISSHLLGELKNVCDRIVFFKDGKVVEDIELNATSERTHIITVDSAERAKGVLNDLCTVTKLGENKILLDSYDEDLNALLNRLINDNVKIYNVETYNDVERIYINKVGGELDVK